MTVVVSIALAGQRADRILSALLPDLSRSRIQALLADGEALWEGQPLKKSDRLPEGACIELSVPPPPPSEAVAEAIPLDTVYVDEDVAVINKAVGMVVHPAAGHPSGTLVNALLHLFADLPGEVSRPGVVHRLDKDTAGLLAVARNERARERLMAQLSGHLMGREYLALVQGTPSAAEGRIDLPIGRDPKNRQRMAVVAGGKSARTRFRVRERFSRFALLSLRLETGRTHQIRVHLARLGCPVVGDPLYGPAGGRGQLLCACRIGFYHPGDGRPLVLSVPAPEALRAAVHYLRQHPAAERLPASLWEKGDS